MLCVIAVAHSTKQRDREGRPEARVTYHHLTIPAPSVGETVTPESA